MPRSSQLKHVNYGNRGGVARLINCPFCSKKGIRSDHFPAHVKQHKEAKGAGNARDMMIELDGDGFTVIDDTNILTRMQQHPDGRRSYSDGICFDCLKSVPSKDKWAVDAYVNHVCKDKKMPKPKPTPTVVEVTGDVFKKMYEDLQEMPYFHHYVFPVGGNSDDEEDTEPVTDASYREAIMDAIEMMVGKLHPRKKPTPAAARPAPTVPASESVAATAESTS
jgi:hypothetical protein